MIGRARTSVHAGPAPEQQEQQREEHCPTGFFTRTLSSLLRRRTVTSPSSSLVGTGASIVGGKQRSDSTIVGSKQRRNSTVGGRKSVQGALPESPKSVPMTAIDEEMVFGVKKYALVTSSGVRRTNEDRFRIITSLELFGEGLLTTERANIQNYDDALLQRTMESYVNKKGSAPAYDVKTLLKAKTASDTEFYGIYDGHGGARCSSLLALLLPLYLLRQSDFASSIESATKQACLAINDEILKREAANECEGGSTAITLLIRKGIAYFCNTGDCRAIIVSRQGITALTIDHKATNEVERKRVEDAGGIVLYVRGVPRVNGRLAVTRAFGDSELKECVIPLPDVTTHELTPEDEFIVLASDGLWDALPNEQVLSCIHNNSRLSTQEMAKVLVDCAIELGSMDNITVLIVDVRKQPRGGGFGWLVQATETNAAQYERTNASVGDDDDSSKAFHAVDIGDLHVHHGHAGRRRRASSSAARSESWMTKVTAAMSQRIFSGKKLGASRSTQAMPLSGVSGASSPFQEKQGSSSVYEDSTQPQTLRQVSSENSLTRTQTEILHSTPVEAITGFCPSVVCDVASNDEDDDKAEDAQQQQRRQPSVVQTIHVKAPAPRKEKIVPREQDHDDDFDFETTTLAQRRQRDLAAKSSRCGGSVYHESSRECRDDEETTASPVIPDPAPILKGYFSRNATTGKGIRVQQRESRRESLYATSRQRQERLRKRVEDDQQHSEATLRQLKAQQLQKRSHERTLQLRHDAADACRDLQSKLARDRDQYAKERERWEDELEEEIHVLTRAFRKARASTTRSQIDDSRPVTVAGLVVPEALSQIHRDASNFEKRLKTAEPRVREDWCRRVTGAAKTKAQAFEESNVDIFLFEDSQDVLEILHDDENEGVLEVALEDVSKATMDELLDERRALLQRIADLEKLVGKHRHSRTASKKTTNE
ncbi:Protein phosphatase, partial [Globisporangium splendens]